MKIFVVIGVVLLIGLACARPDGYTTKYDNIDLDNILKSDRLLSNYMNCLLEKGTCTPNGAEVKSIMHDTLATGCEKCSDEKKEATKKVVRYLLKNKRDWWNELEAKYDPEGKYVAKYNAEFKAEGIVL